MRTPQGSLYRVFDSAQSRHPGPEPGPVGGRRGGSLAPQDVVRARHEEKINRMVLDIASIDVLPSMAAAAFLVLALQCKLAHGGLRLCGRLRRSSGWSPRCDWLTSSLLTTGRTRRSPRPGGNRRGSVQLQFDSGTGPNHSHKGHR